jgi:hypothetical protein
MAGTAGKKQEKKGKNKNTGYRILKFSARYTQNAERIVAAL